MNVKSYEHKSLISLAEMHECAASSWGRRAADAARWGLSDEHANARHKAQAARIDAMLLRSLDSAAI